MSNFAASPPRYPCSLRGAVVDAVPDLLDSCCDNTSIDVFFCPLHGRCVLKPFQEAPHPGIALCPFCPDRIET